MNAGLGLLLSLGIFVTSSGAVGQERAQRFAAERRAIFLPRVVKPSDPEAKTRSVDVTAPGLAAGAAGLAVGGVIWLLAPAAVAELGKAALRPKVVKVGRSGAIVGFSGAW
jgi:hypothetical protein